MLLKILILKTRLTSENLLRIIGLNMYLRFFIFCPKFTFWTILSLKILKIIILKTRLTSENLKSAFQPGEMHLGGPFYPTYFKLVDSSLLTLKHAVTIHVTQYITQYNYNTIIQSGIRNYIVWYSMSNTFKMLVRVNQELIPKVLEHRSDQ